MGWEPWHDLDIGWGMGEAHKPGADAAALGGEMGQQMKPALGWNIFLGEPWEILKT